MIRALRKLMGLRRLRQIDLVDRIVVGLSATIILWNTLPELSAIPVVGIATSVVLSLPRAEITFILGFLELAAVSYAFLPRIYPESLFEPFAGKRWSRILLAAYAAVWASFWYVMLLGRIATGYSFLPTLPNNFVEVYMGVGLVLIGGLLYAIESRKVIHPESHFVRPIRLISGDDPEDIHEENESIPSNLPAQTAYRGLVTIAGTAIYVLPVVIFGSLIGILNVYYPVLELAAILAVAGTFVLQNDLTPSGDSWWKKSFASAKEVNERFYQQIRVATSPRAWSLFLTIILSSLLSLLVLLREPVAFTGYYPTTPGTVITSYENSIQYLSLSTLAGALEASGSVLGWIALKVTPFGFVCYALWFWYRTIRRIPAHLYRAGNSSRMKDLPLSTAIPPVSRPRGYFIPIAILTTAWLSHPLTAADPFITLPFEHSNGRFIAVWLIGLGLLCATLLQTLYSLPNPPKSVLQELVVPVAIHYLIVSDLLMADVFSSGILSFGLLFALLYYMHPIGYAIRSDSRLKRLIGSAGIGLCFGLGAFLAPFYSIVASGLITAIMFAIFAVGTELEMASEG